jgi:2-oxoglutarate ferredoxin oxidoreductase subunit gamma
LLTDKDLVTPDGDREFFSIPSTRMAEELGRKMIANIIMIGFATSVTGLISENAAKEAVLSSVPKGNREIEHERISKRL